MNYDDGGDDESSPSQAESEPMKKVQDEDDGATTLVPKSMFGGKKYGVGDKCPMKIVHEYEDEYEIGHDMEGGEDEPKGTQMERSMGKLAATAARASSGGPGGAGE